MTGLTGEQVRVLEPAGAQHPSEADRTAMANRTNVARVLRKIANRHIAQDYPTTLDGEVTRHAVVIVGLSGNSAVFIDPLKATLTPLGERSVSRELFNEIHDLSLICDLP